MSPEILFKHILMIGLVITLMFVCFLIGWLILSRIVLDVDTRIATAELRWWGIGSVTLWYEGEWWLRMNILFYRKTIRFVEMSAKSPKSKRRKVKSESKKFRMIRVLRKSIRVIQSFRVSEWQLAVDTGDFSSNAQFYYLNFMKPAFGHLHVNFSDENFLVLKIYNYPWKILYAFMR